MDKSHQQLLDLISILIKNIYIVVLPNIHVPAKAWHLLSFPEQNVRSHSPALTSLDKLPWKQRTEPSITVQSKGNLQLLIFPISHISQSMKLQTELSILPIISNPGCLIHLKIHFIMISNLQDQSWA